MEPVTSNILFMIYEKEFQISTKNYNFRNPSNDKSFTSFLLIHSFSDCGTCVRVNLI